MLDYEEFKKNVAADLISSMGEEYESYEVRTMPYVKRGRKLDGISICPPDKTQARTVLPTVSLNELYEEYLKDPDYEDVMDNLACMMRNGLQTGKKLLPETDYKKAKDKIIFQLVNTKSNAQMLEGIPHRSFLDLSVIYRWVIDFSNGGVASVLITDELSELMGLSEKELYNCSKENTAGLLPPVLRDIRDLISDLISEEELMPDMPRNQRMYVVTNRYNFCGANAMLYEEILHDISRELNSDLFILPASVNELILLTASEDKDPEALARIVTEINECDVDESDRLSDCVYYYSASTRRVYITSERKAES